MAVYQLDDELWFPDPHQGEDDGLVAVGGDLSVDRLLLAYSNGFFPWYSFQYRDEPLWYCPLQRFVIFPDEIHVSHSMQQLIKKRQYTVTVNRDFEGVIRGCATAQNRDTEDGAWLGPDIIRAYTELHRQGFAASVEATVGRHTGRTTRWRSLWRHPRCLFLRREHVFARSQRLQTRPYPSGPPLPAIRRQPHRLSV